MPRKASLLKAAAIPALVSALALAGCSAPKFPGGSDKDGNISQRSVEKPTAMVTTQEMMDSTPNSKVYPPTGKTGYASPTYNTPSTYPVAAYPATTYPAAAYPVAVATTYPAPTYPVATYPVASYPVATYPGASYPAPVAVVPVATTDSAFAQQAMSISASEIALARIGYVRGHSPEVKTFARRMLVDHRMTAAEIDNYALERGQLIDWPLNAADQAAINRLQSIDAAAFDRAYVDEAVRLHERTVSLLQAQAAGSSETAALARAALPKVRDHLAMARDLQRRV